MGNLIIRWSVYFGELFIMSKFYLKSLLALAIIFSCDKKPEEEVAATDPFAMTGSTFPQMEVSIEGVTSPEK